MVSLIYVDSTSGIITLTEKFLMLSKRDYINRFRYDSYTCYELIKKGGQSRNEQWCTYKEFIMMGNGLSSFDLHHI